MVQNGVCSGADATAPHLEYEAAHPGAGGQQQEHVGEEHEVALALLLEDRETPFNSSE